MSDATTRRDMFSESMADPEIRKLFEKEWLADEIVVQLERKMEELGLTRKDLAERLGCRPPNVTQLLRKGTNLTLGKMVDLALALDHRFLAPVLVPVSEAPPWECIEVTVQPAIPHTWKAEAADSASPSMTWNIQGIEGEAELCPALLACR